MVEMDEADMALVMEVNVLGATNTTKAFFPLLRRKGQEASPKVINIASEVSAARLSAAMNGPYSMSKFALEAYSTALRQELSLLDDPVSVVVLNPGPVVTPLLTGQLSGGPNAFFERHAERHQMTLWSDQLRIGGRIARSYMSRHATTPDLVARTVVEVVHARQPARRYKINVSWLMAVAAWTPQWIIDAALRIAMRRALPRLF